MADDRYETLLANYRNAWAGLRMIREAVETLGPPGALPSGELAVTQKTQHSLINEERKRQVGGLSTAWGCVHAMRSRSGPRYQRPDAVLMVL
jgi:hypothetical protein